MAVRPTRRQSKTSINGSQKSRSPTSNPHGGSRVEPSHGVQQKRAVRAQKTVRAAKSSRAK